jgi:hypothetical protein
MRVRSGSTLKRSLSALLMTAAFASCAIAGKYCGDPVESGLSSGATQEEALTAAQQWWSSRAGALGRGYESWDNADDRAMECSKDERGTFHCRATGRPCLPEGTLPEHLPKFDT